MKTLQMPQGLSAMLRDAFQRKDVESIIHFNKIWNAHVKEVREEYIKEQREEFGKIGVDFGNSTED